MQNRTTKARNRRMKPPRLSSRAAQTVQTPGKFRVRFRITKEGAAASQRAPGRQPRGCRPDCGRRALAALRLPTRGPRACTLRTSPAPAPARRADARGFDEPMALVGIHHQLGRNAQVAQRVPELERLRRGTLAVAIADHHQRGRLDVLDEVDGRASWRRPPDRRRRRRRRTESSTGRWNSRRSSSASPTMPAPATAAWKRCVWVTANMVMKPP